MFSKNLDTFPEKFLFFIRFAFGLMPKSTADNLVKITDLDMGGRTLRFELGSARDDKKGAGSFGERPKSAPSASLIVKSLSWNVDNDMLMGHFEGCTGGRVLMDRETGQSKG